MASIEDIINQAKQKATTSFGISVDIPSVIDIGNQRNDLLVYASIQTLSIGTNTNGEDLTNGNGGINWVLPPPIDIIDLHSANYEGVGFAEAKVLQNAMKNGSIGAAAAQAGLSLAEFLGKNAANLVSLGFYDLDTSDDLLGVKAMAGQGNIYNQYSTATRTAINPNTELAYRGPNLRQIQFQFRIAPFTSQDANTLKQFIDTMRQYIYPVTDNTVWRMGYPAKFAISVNTVNGGGGGAWSNKRLFSLGHGIRQFESGSEKIGCVLTDMQVSYGELGTYAGHVDGSPSIANINLTFQENLVSTRESITEEYSSI